MGNDGGTILRRSDLVRVKEDGSESKVDPAILAKVLATTCALSRQPLRAPIVSDGVGYLYNKDSVVKYLLSRAELSSSKDQNLETQKADRKFGHIKKLKDVQTLNLKDNPAFSKAHRKDEKFEMTEEEMPAPFICPLTQREMNGRYRFVYLRRCGCVMSESGLRAMISDEIVPKNGKEENGSTKSLCPVCSKSYSIDCIEKKAIGPGGDVIVLNGTDKEVEAQRAAIDRKRAEDISRKKEAKVSRGALVEEMGFANGNRKRKEDYVDKVEDVEKQQKKKVKE